jgi:hypothetical protein
MSTNVENWEQVMGGDAAERGHEGELEVRRVKCELSEPLFKRLLRKLFPDQRKQERIPVPPLVGYLGTMRATKPYEIGDISASGFCLVTDERWETGTEMPITLERTNAEEQIEADCFTVQATVVRWGQEGVGFSIVLSEEESNAAHGNSLRVKSTLAQGRTTGEAPVFVGPQTFLTHSSGD